MFLLVSHGGCGIVVGIVSGLWVVGFGVLCKWGWLRKDGMLVVGVQGYVWVTDVVAMRMDVGRG